MIKKEIFNIKVLYVANNKPISITRVKAYAALNKICIYSDIIFTQQANYSPGIFFRVLQKLKLTPDPGKLNKRLLFKVQEWKPDLIFIVKGVSIKPWTLHKLKQQGCKLVSWSNDDMFGWHNRSIWYTLGLKYYDLVVTQKSYNCNPGELPSLGAKKILFQNKAFDPFIHKPATDCKIVKYKHDVVFVGAYEKERLQSLLFLANAGIEVHIYGWVKEVKKQVHPLLYFHNHYLHEEDYAGVFSCSKICLNFLRKLNRDLQTSRSIEIPACKGFMLAERSVEHLQLFEEGKEAEFFTGDAELFQKIQYYLSHEKERAAIAEAGYKRCYSSHYTFENRMREIIETVIYG
ncbi:MAG: glycosyltransferase [Bacteroidetes bacterium]|nr:glycosyltransferase [Bacteroidota bacterium]